MKLSHTRKLRLFSKVQKLLCTCVGQHLRLPQMISCGPGAALTLHVLVSWCCVLLTAFTCDTCFLRIYLTDKY